MDLLFLVIMVVSIMRVSIAVDSINVSQSISDDKTLVSQGGTFELGFFSPGGSNNSYLGIWYKNIPDKKVVWVANREIPINGSSGMLTVNSTGNLVLSQNGTVVWNTTSRKQAHNPVVELLDSGNLVVRNEGDANPDDYLWQSFDYLSDTALQEMKLGRNLQLDIPWTLTSWNSPVDPSIGDLSWVLLLHDYPEYYMMKGTEKFFRIGPWNGLYFSGTPGLRPNSIFDFSYVANMDEIFYTYTLTNKSVISIAVLNQTTNKFYRYVWAEGDQNWRTLNSIPTDNCDTYGLCGVNSNCMITQVQICQCLQGFNPKSPQAWNSTNWTQGCVRNKPLSCKDKLTDGFIKYEGMKVPDTTYTWVDETIGLDECRVKCLNNCSCMAYTNLNISGTGSGCVMWLSDLIDIRQYENSGQDLYIRMPASELGSNQEPGHGHKKNTATIVATTIAGICVVLLLCTYFIYRRRRKTAEQNNERHVDDLDVPLFDLPTITAATNGFSLKNKIGEGGFGPVYRGILMDGQEIAVKTLSSSSGQGLTEFLNEVKLIAKLQHRNLVRLLGCCIQGQQKMLVYEYMPNTSLDSFIFDGIKSKLLEWPQRYHIIDGIARGLMYLHQDSRLRIIHRDLKASNVLLDENLNPKISDFGNTNRVVGTYGYMAPEYAADGLFSVKSDVFSFGILVLEVICGRRNRGLYHADDSLNLVGHAWTTWKEGKAIDLIDSNIKKSCNESEVLRCLHVSLLCVQQYPEDRPTMASVILMLGSEMELVEPKEPGFVTRNVSVDTDSRSNQKDASSTNEVTISLLEAR
ncbi:G-type lectin S-receptor-like serine/threonine-protein kinase At4g27290 [Abrus precatorius]|uniref:Receptor-like serine/threonine-protein kinase n=1 Tax=Abrus precatorius TaxID=3816 RepID=A0A8B8LIW1_ABRPR|nr:G-type lectin S-receptor-like serine/threonine-protein kinase At4g27290 [Abrus precatorius]